MTGRDAFLREMRLWTEGKTTTKEFLKRCRDFIKERGLEYLPGFGWADSELKKALAFEDGEWKVASAIVEQTVPEPLYERRMAGISGYQVIKAEEDRVTVRYRIAPRMNAHLESRRHPELTPLSANHLQDADILESLL